MSIQIRLKPHDPEKGQLHRGITFAQLGGVYFEHGKIVDSIDGRPITPAVANFLRGFRMRDGGPPAFDVLDDADMKKLVAGEARAKLGLDPATMAALRDEFARDQEPAPQPQAQPTRRRARGAA